MQHELNHHAIQAFRTEVREFIRTHLPDDIRAKVAAERMDLSKSDQRCWHRLLYRRGWACPGWPVEYGGCGWNDAQRYVFEREIALADAPRSMVYGVNMLGPTLIAHGTEAQRTEYLPRILSADDFWCQGFSEPNAGSDLASLKCRAVRDGDHYRISGSKIWTSEAHLADRMFGLFRTDSSRHKHYGISFLLLDMDADGIEVQPIRTFDGGGPEINHVFFTDVRVPLKNLVGDLHQGWKIAKYLLGLERFGTAEISRSMRSLQRIRTLIAEHPPVKQRFRSEPLLGDRLTTIEIQLQALELTEQRLLFSPDSGAAEASLLKLKGSEIQNQILQLLHDVLGLEALGLTRSSTVIATEAAGFAARAHFNYRKTMIYSGTNEIQRNIIAKAVLGL